VPDGRVGQAAVRARRPWTVDQAHVGRTHVWVHARHARTRDPVQRIPRLCAIPAAYLLFLLLFRVPMSGIAGIARAIPAIPSMSVSRNSRNSKTWNSWSYFSDQCIDSLLSPLEQRWKKVKHVSISAPYLGHA